MYVIDCAFCYLFLWTECLMRAGLCSARLCFPRGYTALHFNKTYECLMRDEWLREGLSQLNLRQCRRPETELRNKSLPQVPASYPRVFDLPRPLNLFELQLPPQELPSRFHQLWGMGVGTLCTGMDSAYSSVLSRAWPLWVECRGISSCGWFMHCHLSIKQLLSILRCTERYELGSI